MVAMPESSIQVTSHLILPIPAFTHALFIGLQERFLGNAFNDDTRESDVSWFLVTSHQSPVTSHSLSRKTHAKGAADSLSQRPLCLRFRITQRENYFSSLALRSAISWS